ncbi:hypothetical protein [Actinoplanes teichomyceticus]|uniref:TrbL/VirB6 plasmid conjugal transfer protein n=1 Tax=Actinoplanes teichomyceticus TaxID=1867 RepID=A0A561VSF3_ACTTI|nr:hypothetical protein [Actinoplanes teichomyceticus]TWG14536.1 hypothetical protein FHX34_104836 [Actinoplanes teichomyceticus]
MAKKAINPVMETLGSTVLSTPDPTASPHVMAIWTTCLVVANGIYVLFVIAGAFIITSRESLQSQYGFKQIAPRLVLGAVLSNVSLIICGKGIEATNALTAAILGQGVDPKTAADAMIGILIQPLNAGSPNILLALLVIAALVLALVVIVTFVMRVALMIVLTGFAPMALIFHATPQTENLAYTWWRAFAACLGLQLAQALIVLATIRVFLTPSGLVVLGVPASGEGLLGVLVCLTMLWLLTKLPGLMKQFVLAPMGMQSQGLIGQLLQAYVMFKTFGAAAGLLGGGSRAARTATTARQRAATTTGNATTASTARPISRTGGRSGTPRPAPARPSPPAPVTFSNAPTTQTPLSAPAGTAGAPTFSNPPQPATPTATPTGPAPATSFSHPDPSPAATTRPSGHPAPATFSNATPTPASPTPAGPPPAATFSTPQKPQSAPRRPPAPVTPVFSAAPPTPSTRATAAQRPTTTPAPAPSRTTRSRTAATGGGRTPVTTTPPTATPRSAPSPGPAARPSPVSGPTPADPPPSPPRPAGSATPVFRRATSSPPSPPSPSPATAPSPPSPPPVRRRPKGGKS